MTTSYPWGSGSVTTPQWRKLLAAAGDGVLGGPNDCAATTTGSSTVVTVAAGSILVQGALAEVTQTTLDVGATGTQPTSGQTRIDLIVARYSTAGSNVTIVLLPGTPATSGATAPTLTRSPSGTWDLPLAQITRLGPVNVDQSNIADLRAWIAPTLDLGNVGTIDDLSTDLPHGTQVRIGGETWALRHLGGGTLGWVSVSDPTWASLPLGSGISAGSTIPAYRVHGGALWLRGWAARTGGAAFSSTSTYTLGVLPSGFRPGQLRRVQVSTAGRSGAALNIGADGVIVAIPAESVSVVSLDGVVVSL